MEKHEKVHLKSENAASLVVMSSSTPPLYETRILRRGLLYQKHQS